jgi:glycosyltransferase involved in cell wall biosynthesis
MVSVLVPTFEHKDFIEACLDGILMQRTTFPVEIIIGEDESTDGTREICQGYAVAHPDRIRLLLGSRTDVIEIAGRSTGRFNIKRLLASAAGRYIALCEGDDYWIDPLKLQKQVDILERDQSVSLVFHNAWVKHEDTRKDYFINHRLGQERFTLNEIVSREWFIATASILARAEALKGSLESFDFAMSGDMVMQFHAALHGDLVYVDLVGGVYRRHVGGLSDQYWESGVRRSEAVRFQHEVFRPNQLWTMWVFSRRNLSVEQHQAFERRMDKVMGMVMQYKAGLMVSTRLLHIRELRSFLAECLDRTKPAILPDECLISDVGPEARIASVSLDIWRSHAMERVLLIRSMAELLDCMRVCWDMAQHRLFSRKVLTELMVQGIVSFITKREA